MICAVAGTFDVLHEGHRRLLSRAFESGDEVRVGITSDAMASTGRSETVPLEIRRNELESYLRTLGECKVFVIDDMYGPDEMMDDVDVLVVSEETLDNGRILNERRASRGLKPMELSVVPLLMSAMHFPARAATWVNPVPLPGSSSAKLTSCWKNAPWISTASSSWSWMPAQMTSNRTMMERSRSSLKLKTSRLSPTH